MIDYKVARDQIKDGDVLAFRLDRLSIFSQLISLVTRSRVTHVGFAVRYRNRLCVLEALEGKGVRLHPVSIIIATGRDVDWYQLQAADNKRMVVVARAFNHWGKRYASPLQFLRSWGVITSALCDWLRIPIDTNEQRFFCSEFVHRCLKPKSIEAAKMAPADIIELPELKRMGTLKWTGDMKL
jgi:hypothetical protein